MDFDLNWIIGLSDGIPRRISAMELPDWPETDDQVARCIFEAHNRDHDATVAACGIYALARKSGKSVFDAYGEFLERAHAAAHA